MKERVVYSIMALVLVLGMALTLATPVAAAPPPLNGNVEADFIGPGILIINDTGPQPDVGMPGTPPGMTGWEVKDLRLAYVGDTMYVGINVQTIIGDADGDGDPSGTSAYLTALGGTDLADLGSSETVAVYFDLDQDGFYDVIAGINGTTDYYGFSVNVFKEPYYPPFSFGAPLPSNIGSISPNPDAAYPDLEFTITNWSTLPGNDGDFSFCVGAFIGSLQDAGIGEDFLDYCQSPDICIEKTVDCNNDGVFKDVDVGYAGDTAHWKVVVTNCGDCNVTNVIVTDSNGHYFGPAFNLSAGAPPVEFNYDTTVSVNTTNNATVTATDALGGTVSDWDIATNNVISPDICIEKTVDCNNDGIFKDVDVGYAGDTAHWKVVVWNCGGSNLTNVTVTDTNLNPFGAPFNLPAGAPPVEFNYDTVVSVNTTNNATVTATDLLGGTVSAWDIATNNVISPDICIEKTVDCNDDGIFLDEDTGSAGDTAHWKVVVWNCGGSNLTNVTVTDTNLHNFGAPFNLPAGAPPVEFNYDTVVNVNTTNNATVTATDLLGGTVSAWDIATNNVINPKLCIDKTVDCNDDGVYSKEETTSGPFDDADWKVVVRNCGAAPVYNITVTDTNLHDFGASFNLTVGANQTFNYTTVISATTKNTATAVGKDALGNTVGPVYSSATNRIVGIGCLQICKFQDTNVNGMWDPGEPWLPDWRFHVTGYGYDEWATTGADGCVVVSGLDSGTYTVTEELKAGWYNTRPGGDPPYEQEVTVEAGADCARVEFGNREEIRDIPPMVPAMSEWGIIAMVTVFAGLLVWTVRRKRLASRMS